MNTSTTMKRLATIAGSALIGLMLATGVYAEVEQVTAEVEFVTPVSIGENASLRFGLLDVNLASLETVVIAPDGNVTDASGNVAGGTQGAADLTVGATASQAITITVGTTVAATGYTLDTWMCSYDGGTDTDCSSGSGYGEISAGAGTATLLVGVTLTGNGSAPLGTDNSTFDVTVIYQ